jgi:hypothetical protein
LGRASDHFVPIFNDFSPKISSNERLNPRPPRRDQ